jgi:hypothetical protein
MQKNYMVLSLILLSIASTTVLNAQDKSASAHSIKMPMYRIDTTDFNASESDIRQICNSAGSPMWEHFTDYSIEPFVVTRGKEGPITLFKRNERREIVLKLHTEKTFWSQYAYQFAHEFCHILCGFREGDRSNLWFEETLCETASLYAVRAMAKRWKDNPPYQNWRDYRDSLRDYADTIMKQRTYLPELHEIGMQQFYLKYADKLKKIPTDRELNGAMAVFLLHMFEQHPQHWEAIRWLNTQIAPENETFNAYLQRWHASSPENHRSFIRDVAKLYGFKLDNALTK